MELIKEAQVLGAVVLLFFGSMGYITSKGYKEVGQLVRAHRLCTTSIVCCLLTYLPLGGITWGVGSLFL
ncbi:hypothetical protein ABER99_21435 [Paenibacillus glucanolyticus]|jgi:hypothetical protein|uniref:Uncharacterized protein n=1 Tax=Paenibacillus glucanolyticus TaxID=59843 RepID=A0A163G5G1_9BACL|nr:hypothetical protein [Paenibacillus glucanolyticus]KZS44742.1 hypothetical protein AWU65_01765 [Paenibacillus glucanolyticus]OMF64409.1 hypothetical protein BK142_32000 [Paenibacillus glucanolyticus]